MPVGAAPASEIAALIDSSENFRVRSMLRVEGPRAFKMTIKEKDGRWYLYAASGGAVVSSPRSGFDVIDVTDPDRPVHLRRVLVPNGSGQITSAGNLLIAGQQQPFSIATRGSKEDPFGGAPVRENELATLYDISDPADPKRISAWKASGWGTHRNVYPGGRYAFMSAWVPGYHGQAILLILDVSDPRRPKEAGRWAWPGQAEGGTRREPPNGYHGPATLSDDGRTLSLGYSPGVVNLDIADPAKPQLIGKLEFSPLPHEGTQSIHSFIPIGNGMYHLSSEPGPPGCRSESLSFAAIVDNGDKTKPRLHAFYPAPRPAPGLRYRSFCDKEGRVGPHNINGEIHLPEVRKPEGVLFGTFFNAGLRAFDVSNPDAPTEVGHFMQKMEWKKQERGLEDVLVDRRGNIYATAGRQGQIWILNHIGD